MEPETCYARNRAAWRRWLARHHASSRAVWLVFYKKHTGRPSVTYPEALEEALCFGWIDSIVKRVDHERYMQKFTPRVNAAKWSAKNLRLMRRLSAEGRVTTAGWRVLGVPLDNPAPEESEKSIGEGTAQPGLRVPGFVRAAIARSPKAASFWQTLPPGCRKRYVGWILAAKREETRERRLAAAVSYLEAGTKSLIK